MSATCGGEALHVGFGQLGSFGAPIDTTKPARVSEEKWVATVKKTTQESLERAIADLLEIRASDPYRELNPLAWRAAIQPPAEA